MRKAILGAELVLVVNCSSAAALTPTVAPTPAVIDR